MGYELKTNTAVRVPVGPLVDPTDGKTAETALDVTALLVQIYQMKTDGTTVVRTAITPTADPGGSNAMVLVTSSTDGMYDFKITASQINWLGNGRISFYDIDGFLVHYFDISVVSANYFDNKYGSTREKVDLSATGLDAIVSTATGMVEIAKAVWDRILSGATHNISTSAGKRVRQIQVGAYEHASVWMDTVNGTPGAVDFENGTVDNPVDNITDATTLALSIGLKRFQIAPGSSITLIQPYNSFLFNGSGWALALGGQDVGSSVFCGASISGTSAGTEAHYIDCTFNVVSLSLSHAHKCAIAGPVTLNAAGDYFFIESYSAVAGTSAPIVDFGVAVLSINLNVRNYSGGIDIRNMGQAGTDNMSLEGRGQLIINANCVGGIIAIRGNITLTNNGSSTISDDARIDTDQINAEVDKALDTPIPETPTADSINERIKAIPENIRKNEALNNFKFFMRLTSDHVTGATGLSVTSKIQRDAGAFVSTTNTAIEIGLGWYRINFTAADLNADSVALEFTGTGADATIISIPKLVTA